MWDVYYDSTKFSWFWHRTSDFWGLGIGSHWWCRMWAYQARSGTPRRNALTLNPTQQTMRKKKIHSQVQYSSMLYSLGDSITFNHWVVSFWITCPSTWPVGGLKVWAIGTGVVSCRWVHWNKLRCLYSMWWPWMRHLSKALVYPSPYIRTGLQRLMNIDEL